jgi:Flp pilus assembly protein TadD
MTLSFVKRLTFATLTAAALSACAVSPGYNESEQEIVNNLKPSKFQPASRELRDNIETQDNFAQAAFWSKEYQLNPGDLEAAIKLSAAVRKMGNASRAVEIAQTSRALYPNDPYLTAEYAAALIATERGSESIKALDAGLRAAPGYARLWSLKGAALDQMEKYDLARKHYGRALQITPQDPNIMANLGLSYALAGDPKTAETWLRRASNMPNAGANIQQNLDLIMQLQGKTPSIRKSAEVQTPTLRRNSEPQLSGGYIPRSASTPARQAPTGYRPAANAQSPQYRSNVNVVGGSQKIRSASDAARAAMQQSQKQNRRVVVPHAPGQPSQIPENILNQIAKNVGPRSAQGPANTQPYSQSAQGYPAPQQTNRYPYPQYGQVPPQTQPQTYQQPAVRRGAARRRE